MRDEAIFPNGVYRDVLDEIGEVEFMAEVVGWDDKRGLEDGRWHAINRIVWSLQPNEGGVNAG